VNDIIVVFSVNFRNNNDDDDDYDDPVFLCRPMYVFIYLFVYLFMFLKKTIKANYCQAQ
jgi:hypothetical protein